MRISKVFLYDEPSVPEIKINDLAKFIENMFEVEVEIRKNFFQHFKSDSYIASELASSRVFNLISPFEKHQPTQEEINFEVESFNDSSISNNIILYDGFELQNLTRKIITDDESTLDKFHLIFTARLACTYDYNDYRYHGRAVICSNPSIISTTGIIEAPAKPREYYFKLYQNMTQGINQDALKEQFRGRFLEYHDKNLDRIVRGYALQAIFYYLTSNPFCDSIDCILYNAHWQEELIHAQINLGKFCTAHQKILESILKHE